ncbi:MAG: hypothetical protein ACK5P4_08295 [Bacteroidota bacterium]|jgi:DNA polymerase III alpha subunit
MQTISTQAKLAILKENEAQLRFYGEHSSLNEVEIASLTQMITVMSRLTFQKSHSLSYSIVGYWDAFYKVHFRTHFDKAFSNNIKYIY